MYIIIKYRYLYTNKSENSYPGHILLLTVNKMPF